MSLFDLGHLAVNAIVFLTLSFIVTSCHYHCIVATLVVASANEDVRDVLLDASNLFSRGCRLTPCCLMPVCCRSVFAFSLADVDDNACDDVIDVRISAVVFSRAVVAVVDLFVVVVGLPDDEVLEEKDVGILVAVDVCLELLC